MINAQENRLVLENWICNPTWY